MEEDLDRLQNEGLSRAIRFVELLAYNKGP